MGADTIRDLRDHAKQLGVPWRQVCELKDHLVEIEQQKRASTDGGRKRAWELLLAFRGWTRGCLSFWRCGWSHTRRRIERNGDDYTAIPRYDEIAATLRTDFPEFGDWSTQEIFDWLLQEEYSPMPPRRAFYEDALAMIASHSNDTATSEAPF